VRLNHEHKNRHQWLRQNRKERASRDHVRSEGLRRAEAVAVNDLTDAATQRISSNNDSVFGIYPGEVSHKENSIIVDGREIKIHSEKDPRQIPWKADGVDVVIVVHGKV
jgi:glyceraldehyde-3-phosphate dehydrogenase/erythrose-4-phosphate dehydrogenase